MKALASIMIIGFVLLIHQTVAQPVGQSKPHSLTSDSIAYFDRLLSVSEMQQDLRLFRDIRDKANSGLYRYRTRKQIDSIYKQAWKEIAKPLSTSAFYKIILTLTDFEGSCHNYTEMDERFLAFLKRQKSFFPYALKYIEGRIIFNNNTNKIAAGSEVLSINGIKAKDLMKSFYKYLPADGFTITEKMSASVNGSFGLRYIIEYGVTDSFMLTYSLPGSKTVLSTIMPAVSSEERDKMSLPGTVPLLIVSSITGYSQPIASGCLTQRPGCLISGSFPWHRVRMIRGLLYT